MQNFNEDSREILEDKVGDSSVSYSQYKALLDIEKQNIEKYESFKTRIKQFEEVRTLEEARELSEKILPIAGNRASFRVGNAKCTVISTEEMFRICVDTAEEFISYDFAWLGVLWNVHVKLLLQLE